MLKFLQAHCPRKYKRRVQNCQRLSEFFCLEVSENIQYINNRTTSNAPETDHFLQDHFSCEVRFRLVCAFILSDFYGWLVVWGLTAL